MQIVALLDVDKEKFTDEEHHYSLDEITNKFIGYYNRPLPTDKYAIVVTGHDFYGTNQPVHKFNFDNDML